jgi:hypothetical protein
LCHSGLARSLSLPMQVSTRMVWCAVCTTYDWKQRTSLSCASSARGASQDRFSANTSGLSAGKNSSAGLIPYSISTIRWIVISPTRSVQAIGPPPMVPLGSYIPHGGGMNSGDPAFKSRDQYCWQTLPKPARHFPQRPGAAANQPRRGHTTIPRPARPRR